MKKIYLLQARNVCGYNQMSEWSNLYAVKTEEEAKADVKRFREKYIDFCYEEIDII